MSEPALADVKPADSAPPNPASDPKPEDTPAPAKTLVEGGGSEPDVEAPSPSDFPADWRERFAKGDEKLLKRLQRFQSPENVLAAWRNAEQKISSGSFKKALPEDASEEEVARWRKENDVPEDPKAYSLDLPEGRIIGEQDKPVIGKIAEAAHAANVSQRQMTQLLAAYYDTQEEQAARRAIRDDEEQREAQETLRAEWGPDYKVNTEISGNLFGMAPEGLAQRLLLGRTSDGRVIGNDPDVLRFFTALAREINPVPTLVPGGGRSMSETVEERLAAVRALQQTDPKKYWSDEIQQQELRLLDQRMKLKERGR